MRCLLLESSPRFTRTPRFSRRCRNDAGMVSSHRCGNRSGAITGSTAFDTAFAFTVPAASPASVVLRFVSELRSAVRLWADAGRGHTWEVDLFDQFVGWAH